MLQRNMMSTGTALLMGTVLWASALPAHAVDDANTKCNFGRDLVTYAHVGCIHRVLMKYYGTNPEPLDFARCDKRLQLDGVKLQAIAHPRCSAARWTDNGDGTISDTLTGLIWEKKDNKDGVQNFADPHDADNYYTWTSPDDGDLNNEDGTVFTDFLDKLNAGAGFAGSKGWRLPTFEELHTIVNAATLPCGGTGPACLDPVFGPVATGYNETYATSETWHFGPDWTVVWQFGYAAQTDVSVEKVYPTLVARAVRSGDY